MKLSEEDKLAEKQKDSLGSRLAPSSSLKNVFMNFSIYHLTFFINEKKAEAQHGFLTIINPYISHYD